MNGFVKFLLILVILTTLGNLVNQVILWAPPVVDSETAGGNGNGTGDNNNQPGGGNNSGTSVTVGSSNAPYLGDVHVSATVEPDEDGKVPAGGVSLDSTLANATVPEGVQMEEGATELTLTVNGKEDSEADLDLNENEVSTSLDVHMAGVASDNAIPMEITLVAAAAKGLNSGNIKLYHVENGETVEMVCIGQNEEFTAHNQFKYDPTTGDVTLYMASFSEIAVVADTANEWDGTRDYSWYTNNSEGNNYVIANAEQLAAFGAIVGEMAKTADGVNIAQDSFAGKTVKLVADIDLGDNEENNREEIIFYPIGYWNNEGTYERKPLEERTTPVSSGFYTFEGTFDGNGHTIENFYQNTWEMKGDHDWYNTTTEQYFRDGMGLFGRLYKATVKNLTVKNFKSDGEITTTGTIAAYAEGTTFENIAIFDCNPRVYNIGNGGIVGCVGWYAKEADLKTTFKNITVDNSNKISALWGSYDVACGGIVGQYYPTSGQTSAGTPKNAGIEFTNCHVSAIMDVYNDVCANYQYYAYRYTGMMIGSVRENETIDGRVYPKMDGITASGCTVHFGDWNDYYYCEIVANTTASYTHDHQMSRLTQVADVNSETMEYLPLGETEWEKIPTSGWAHYVVVKAKDANGKWIHGDGHDYAECYHFQNGEVWTHEMAGYHNGENGEKFIDENGDGVGDLKEDKQLVYREFDQLVTGYGWGVTSKGVTDYEGVTNMDITEGEYEESVKKFDSNISDNANLYTETIIYLSEIFKIGDASIPVVNPNVQVTVSPVDKNNSITATYTADTTDWTNGKLVFNGTGYVNITITDYFFCESTTITVKVTAIDKFESKFTNETFTYRVGNENAITLGVLFRAIAENISSVSVRIENVSGTAAGTYTANTDWTKGTIQFNGNGVVKVTISADSANELSLELEVIDATNVTSATSATTNNVVLLQDCTFSSIEVSNGYALYGNGFTMTCSSDSTAADLGYAFVTLSDGTLDNVQIVCPNFDFAALYKSQLTSSDNRSETDANGKTRYYNAKSGVMVSGNSQILNSRISGGRAAVNVSGGNCVIDNSRIELGAVASLLVGSAANSLTLRDVTLVQKPTASTYDSSKTLMGFSALLICNSEGNAAHLILEGTLVQNAWANEDHKQYVPASGQSIVTTVLKQEKYLHNINGKSSLNLGFAYIPEDITITGATPVNNPITENRLTDNRTNTSDVPYSLSDKIDSKFYVYSYENSKGTNNAFVNVSDYTPNKYSDIITITYNDTTEGLTTGKSYGANGWIYELNVDLDKASGYALDFSKLSMTVNGVSFTDYKVNGNAKPTSTIAVTAGGTTYVLTATIDGKEYTGTLKVTGTETSKESPSLVASNYIDGLCVASSYGGTWHGAAPALVGIQIKYWSVAEQQYKTISLSDYTPTTKGKLNETNKTWTYSPDNGDFTLTLTGGQVHSSNNVYSMPVSVDTDNDGTADTLYFVAASSNGLVNSGNSARTISVSYSFKDNNNGTELTFSHTWSVAENKEDQYKYSDFCNGTKTKLESSGPCVTPDTLVTLADGTQKRIDEITYDDQLLVWDFYNGKYAVAPSAIIFNHGYANNTIIKLSFSDGTVVKVANLHQFFDCDLNEFVSIDAESVAQYVGHKFAKQSGDGYTEVTLVDYEVSVEYEGAYGIISAFHYNILVEGMISTDFMYEDYDLFNYFEVGENMTFDKDQMQADIEKYGLYSYEDFADYLTYEQFVGFNVQYFKIAVGKGTYTYEGILDLIAEYLK